jgi:hypothetical protein
VTSNLPSLLSPVHAGFLPRPVARSKLIYQFTIEE